MKRMWYRTGMVEKPTKPGRRSRSPRSPSPRLHNDPRAAQGAGEAGRHDRLPLPPLGDTVHLLWLEVRVPGKPVRFNPHPPAGGSAEQERREFFEMCCVNSLKSGRREKQKEPFLQNLVFEPIQANESYDAASGRCPVVFTMSTQSTQITSQPHSPQPRSGAGPGAGSHLRR